MEFRRKIQAHTAIKTGFTPLSSPSLASEYPNKCDYIDDALARMASTPHDLPALLRVLIGIHDRQVPNEMLPESRIAIPVALQRAHSMTNIIPRLALTGLVSFTEQSQTTRPPRTNASLSLTKLLNDLGNHAKDAQTRLEQLEGDWCSWRAMVASERKDMALEGIIDYLTALPALTASQISAIQGVARKTALRRLSRLETLGILQEARGGKRNKIYVASDLKRYSRASRAAWKTGASSIEGISAATAILPPLPQKPMDFEAIDKKLASLFDEVEAQLRAYSQKWDPAL